MLKDTDNDQMGVFHNNDGVNRIHKQKGGVGKLRTVKKGGISLELPTQKNFFFILVEKFYETLMVIVQ